MAEVPIVFRVFFASRCWESRRRAVVIAVATLSLMWSVIGAHAAWAEDPIFAVMAVAHLKPESEAADFTLKTPEGRSVTLSALRGQGVLLNFWATWCPPCRLEMPSMERLRQEFKDQGLVILAVDIEESPKLVAKFMKEFRLGFPALLDSDSKVSSRYRVLGLPDDRPDRSAGASRGDRRRPAGLGRPRGTGADPCSP